MPDDSALRLVVLAPERWYAREDPKLAFDTVLEWVRQNGQKPRYRGNRLLFLAPDHGSLARLRDTARVALAWGSIVDDVREGRLNIDLLQKKQAEKELQTANEVVPRAARECFKWLLCPGQDVPTAPEPTIEAFALNTGGRSIGAELERVCDENELVISTWSPIHLRDRLRDLYWRSDRTAVGAFVFWEDTLRYLYLPRLKNRDVLVQAIRAGASKRDFFGTANRQTGDTFDGFALADGSVQVDATLLLIEPAAAAAYEAANRPAPPAGPKLPLVGTIGDGGLITTPTSGSPTEAAPPPPTAKPRSFHGTAEVTAATAKMRMVQIADEVVSLLCADPNAKVRVTVEISADFPAPGAPDQIRRAVSENANSLGFKTKVWE